jgi:hypothetical protein
MTYNSWEVNSDQTIYYWNGALLRFDYYSKSILRLAKSAENRYRHDFHTRNNF